ncbi:MAG: hypothetical protein NT166_08830 [Candidatus Aminicenantes bacterium]|nr:hypothetical protein [Candidatus Aminicenantes bacterium]
MKHKIFLLLVLFFNLVFVLDAKETPLLFQFFRYPENVVIPSEIDFDDFEVTCKIEYGYTGDWIGGCSREKYCNFYRMANVNAKLSYLDKNDKELYIVDYPKTFDRLKTFFGYSDESLRDENFVFREDLVYEAEFPILSTAFFKLKELKELILAKKITKIQIVLEKVVINWTYSCEERNRKTRVVKNSIKLEGKYEFQIDKKYVINVKYAQE